jgi:hypothetical protein
LAVGAFSRLPRVNPKDAVQYEQWTIPPGVRIEYFFENLSLIFIFQTAIGMSNLFISMSPDIFPFPKQFNPDRWGLPNSPERRRLEHYLHPFGKGTYSTPSIDIIIR